MALDYDRKKAKEIEIINNISEVFLENNTENYDSLKISKIILDSAIYITPPEKEELMMEMMTLQPSGRGGGKSRKLGNIKLNINKLVEALANGSLAIAGSIQTPLLIPMAFIILWSSLRKVTDISISENDAAVLWTMWVNRDRSNNEVPDQGLLQLVNQHLSKYDRSSITQKDLLYSLDNLEKIKSIKKSKENWWLCEWIKIKYK